MSLNSCELSLFDTATHRKKQQVVREVKSELWKLGNNICNCFVLPPSRISNPWSQLLEQIKWTRKDAQIDICHCKAKSGHFLAGTALVEVRNDQRGEARHHNGHCSRSDLGLGENMKQHLASEHGKVEEERIENMSSSWTCIQLSSIIFKKAPLAFLKKIGELFVSSIQIDWLLLS